MNSRGISAQEAEALMAVVRQIPLSSMQAYLDANGWEMRSERFGVFATYVKGEHHAVLPLKKDVTAYDDAVTDFIRVVVRCDTIGDGDGVIKVMSQLHSAFAELPGAESINDDPT